MCDAVRDDGGGDQRRWRQRTGHGCTMKNRWKLLPERSWVSHTGMTLVSPPNMSSYILDPTFQGCWNQSDESSGPPTCLRRASQWS